MENPFSTKFWSAGVIPFQFTQHESIDSVFDRLRQHRICQIAGPHGSGKSTLLLSLLKRFEKSGGDARYLLFNDQQRRLPKDIVLQPQHTIFADGFEQLQWRDRLRLLLRSKRLILTVHRPVWFVPMLYRTTPKFSVFAAIVRQRMSRTPTESELREIFTRSGGNFRTAFFELYDQWEGEKELGVRR